MVSISGFVVRESAVLSALDGRLGVGQVRVETVFLGRASCQRQWLKELIEGREGGREGGVDAPSSNHSSSFPFCGDY